MTRHITNSKTGEKLVIIVIQFHKFTISRKQDIPNDFMASNVEILISFKSNENKIKKS
jgi:hypothetical protein